MEPIECLICGCTQDDCSGCIERTGRPCSWAAEGVCSACAWEIWTNRVGPDFHGTYEDVVVALSAARELAMELQGAES